MSNLPCCPKKKLRKQSYQEGQQTEIREDQSNRKNSLEKSPDRQRGLKPVHSNEDAEVGEKVESMMFQKSNFLELTSSKSEVKQRGTSAENLEDFQPTDLKEIMFFSPKTGKMRKKVKAFDEEEGQVGRYMFDQDFKNSISLKIEYERNTDDFYEFIMTHNYRLDGVGEHLGKLTSVKLQEFVKENRALIVEYSQNRGLPAEHRWMCWKVMLGSLNHIQLLELQYMANENSGMVGHAIGLDSDETYRSHPFFYKKVTGRFVGKEKLVKLAKSLYFYYKKDWYFRGASSFLAFLLVVSGGDEIEAANFYISLESSRRFQINQFKKGSKLFHDFFSFLFEKELQKNLPEIKSLMDKYDINENDWVRSFWIHLFSEIPSMYHIARIWDFIITTNIFSSVQVALAIVSLLKTKILLISDGNSLSKYLKKILDDPNLIKHSPNFIITVASRDFPLSTETISQAIEGFKSSGNLGYEDSIRIESLLKLMDEMPEKSQSARFESNINVKDVQEKIPTFKLHLSST